MYFPRLASSIVLALAATACSDSEPSSPVTTNAPNQPSNGGSASTGAAGAAGAAGAGGTTSNGGSGSEAPPTPSLNQGGTAATAPGAANAGAAGSGMPPVGADAAAPEAVADDSMSFFLASRGSGNGGNFGGIAGADALCATLATAANPALAAKTWRAYLSTSIQNARDRIGAGPWRNAAGVIIANNVEELHDQATGGASEANYPLNDSSIALREDGTPLPGQPVTHDILTGSNLDGTVSASGTCSDWTATTGTTRNGHSNRAGGGQNPSSWNSAHDTGCAEPNPPGSNFQAGTVSQGGGIGAVYCFAVD
jgi:hypothetical protein